MIELIYCAAGNKDLASIAIQAGWTYGARLPDTVYFPPAFADQHYVKPDRAGYMEALAKHRPRLATVLDLEYEYQLREVISWAEEAAAHVTEAVIIIPKAHRIISFLPRSIGGVPVRLGYSVPTSYGGTTVQFSEFRGWPVHLLGGAPHRQMALTRFLDVWSADTNYPQKLANRNCQFWQPGTARYARNRYWPTLAEADGEQWRGGAADANAHHEAFRRSCIAISQAWLGQEVTLWGLDRHYSMTFQQLKLLPPVFLKNSGSS